MKKVILNVMMWISTVSLIIILVLGILFKDYSHMFFSSIEFIIWGTITLFLKNKLLQEKEGF
ncbi:hypothetical protein QYB43_001503 [Clostridium perfringens]|nr:hypothetical protein [Clostridium perfringens]